MKGEENGKITLIYANQKLSFQSKLIRNEKTLAALAVRNTITFFANKYTQAMNGMKGELHHVLKFTQNDIDFNKVLSTGEFGKFEKTMTDFPSQNIANKFLKTYDSFVLAFQFVCVCCRCFSFLFN